MKKRATKRRSDGATKPAVTSGYDYIDVTADAESITMRYQVTGLKVPGSDRIDGEDLSDWTDQDVKNRVCDQLGLDRRFADEIDLDWC